MLLKEKHSPNLVDKIEIESIMKSKALAFLQLIYLSVKTKGIPISLQELHSNKLVLEQFLTVLE